MSTMTPLLKAIAGQLKAERAATDNEIKRLELLIAELRGELRALTRMNPSTPESES